MASHPGIVFRLLTWNLYHGRDAAPNPALHTWRSRLTRLPERGATHVQVNRPLRREFATALAGWEWDVALLQEAPPRWLVDLERATDAEAELVLTSRNAFAPLRAALAEWNPDLIASNEGGSNMTLVRRPAEIVASERVELARRPERRAMLMTRLALPGGRSLVVANVHLSVPATGRAAAEAQRAAELATTWADGDPLVLGGDFNIRPQLDRLLGMGLDTVAAPAALPDSAREVEGPDGLAIRLSDHAPVAAAFRVP